ncbi:MAG: DNA polymerase III subunit delta [Methylococcales bacterium]|nr:DNA polymerase III subunit delta [Methylococcales bacterium]
MRSTPKQINALLQKGLLPVYLITGDEPLQQGEVADVIRKAARKAGFINREVLSVDTHFDWNSLAVSADSMSIFADKQIIELRFPNASPGVEGSKSLISYCDRPDSDTLLLITMGKLGKDALKARWFQALDKVGCVIQIWPQEGQDLISWLQQRLQQRGLVADIQGVKILASRTEGNMLAAAQEIEKLYVLYGAEKLSSQQIENVVADSSRYDVYKLVDAVLSGNVKRIFKVISGLQAEGVAAPIVLWALTKEARSLIKVQQAIAQGQNRALVYKNNQIWDKRQALVESVLNKLRVNDFNKILLWSTKADQQIKGQQSGNAWETILAICLLFAAVKPMANAD